MSEGSVINQANNWLFYKCALISAAVVFVHHSAVDMGAIVGSGGDQENNLIVNETPSGMTVMDALTGMLGMGLGTEKVISLLMMTSITFLCGMLPLRIFSQLRDNEDISSRIRWRMFISFCSCFAGGVFFGACILDLLPDVREQMDQVKSEIMKQYHIDLSWLPAAECIMGFGFWLILFIEQFVLQVQERAGQEDEREPLLSSNRRSSIGSYHSTHSHQHGDHHHHHHQVITTQSVSTHAHHTHEGHHGHSHIDHGVFQNTSLRAVMLLLALSFHSIFEGIAIGLQNTDAKLVSIFLAVISHKAVMAFSLGLNIAQSSLSRMKFTGSIIMFSISSPIGVGIGMAVADLPPSLPQDICNAVLQGVACGTFLYITCFEILPNEMNVPYKRMWKWLCGTTGFLCILGLISIIP